MYCLRDYVGIKDASGDAPASGRYINQLPGISLKSIQRIANKEQETFVEVWSDIQDRAWDKLKTDVRNKLRAKFNIKTNRDFYSFKTVDQNQTIDHGAFYRGFVYDTGFDRNGFFAFFVTSVTIDLPMSYDSISIKLFDRAGNVLDTLTITAAVSGINIVPVNKYYAASMIYFAVDATSIALKTTYITTDQQQGYYNFLFNFLGSCCSPNVYGTQTELNAPYCHETIAYNTYGLSAVVMAVCDYSQIICWDKDLFLKIWMYALAIELMIERLYTERVNDLSTVNRDQAEELRDLFTADYENDLSDIIKGININADDGCIECAKRISTKERLP